ncbi:hypothetical protein PISL3812_06638 [Talaromyces islandicus]|uniref:Uncharacterized protein n=1 Tax=Talaromyces islandicus TaxID=28573 RepID=A0A0U1M3K1_TALIS|nr:hypothetical protein PISL3812_06638 [Talaromyces islandicus]
MTSPQWKTTSPVPLTRENFLELLAGQVPLILESEFISSEVSEKVLACLQPKFTPYLHATGPSVDKVGISQFEFQAQSVEDLKTRRGDEKQRYFDEVAKVAHLHDELASQVGANIWAAVVKAIAALVPEYDVDVAKELDGRQYFSGIFRQINNGVPPHCDWCPHDCHTEEWIIRHITCQAVFNLYLTPSRGGATTIYDVQWSPEALEHRDPETYGYARALVDDRPRCRWQPAVGQLCIFNSRNMHEVKPIEEGDPARIAMASFMGILPSEVTGGRPRLMFWS